MMQLLESGGVQTKLRISQPGDADEQQADRAAEQIVSRKSYGATGHAPVLQRKCACGGSCSSCKSQEEQEQVIHRSAAGPLSSFTLSIQRAAAEEPSHKAAAAGEGARHDQAKHPGERAHTVIVEDDAPSVASGQMRKTEFLNLLQSSTCATADAVLEAVGHTTKGCPYIKKWLAHYRGTDAQHLTRAMHKYAPETIRARSAHEAIALVNHRVQRAALNWAKTGKVSDLPEGIQEEMGGGGKKESGGGAAGAGAVQRKSRDGAAAGAHDAAAVREQLGSGHSLDGRAQSQMSSAFGYDFSSVRVHTDAKAGELSSQLNARAFTIGSDVAFAGGEYKPGTLVGDALIAHELAHVVQQGGGTQAGMAQSKDAGLSDDSALEQEADRSAVGAVVSAWTGAKKGLAEIGANALPRLKSGLMLQKCNGNKKDKSDTGTTAAWTVEELKKNLATCDGGTGAAALVKSVTIKIGPTEFGAHVVGAEITIDPEKENNTCSATQALVQELTNFSHKADTDKVQADAAAGKLSREEFMRGMERQEYDGVWKVIKAFDACKDKWGGCPTCLMDWARKYATFEDYYVKALSKEHKEHYGTWWDDHYKAEYEKKHPPAPAGK
jgi:hypothetical protein